MAFEGEKTGAEAEGRGQGRPPGGAGREGRGSEGGGAPAPRAFVIPNRQRFLLAMHTTQEAFIPESSTGQTLLRAPVPWLPRTREG